MPDPPAPVPLDPGAGAPGAGHGVTWPVKYGVPGGPTRGQARGPAWRTTSSGLVVPAEVDGLRVEQRIAEAAAQLPEYGGVTGWAGLRWMGGAYFNGESGARPVVIATGPHQLRPRPGLAVSEERLSPRDLTVHDGVRVTTAVRSVCFEMRYARTLWDAVVALDMAAYNDLVSLDEVARYALEHPGWTGIPRCREAVVLADENSWSPMETATRRCWTHDAGLPRPLANRPLFDLEGRHIGTPDLIDPEAGLVCEYDGALHLAGEQRARDVRRDERYRAFGLEVVVVVSADLSDRDRLAARMRAARDRALRNAGAPRPWTLEIPDWWVPTHTVELRRALDEQARLRWLRLRLQAG